MIEPRYWRGVASPMVKHLLFVAAIAPVVVGAQIPATAARPAAPLVSIDRVVAIVGDQPLLFTTVLTAINQRGAQGLQLPTDSAGQTALARTVLDDLVTGKPVQKSKELPLEVTAAD